MKRILSALALALVALSSVRADAQGLFAATGGNGNPGQLFAINPVNATATLVGSLQITVADANVCPVAPCLIGLSGLAFHPLTGILYGFTGNSGPATALHSLVTIDPSTAVATVVTVDPLTSDPLGDIAFDSAGNLFGWQTGSGAKSLVSINLADGVQTPIGNSGFLATNGNGLSFVGATLYVAPNSSGDETLYTVDPTTGAVTPGPILTAAPITPAVINALATNGLGVLYGVNTNRGAPATTFLVTIDPATGIVTSQGQLPDNTDALAFVATASPDLQITKTHSGNFFQGEVGAQYTITVSNVGGAPTSGTITVTDTIPVGLVATSINSGSFTCTQPSGPCTTATALPAGLSFAGITLTVNVATNAPLVATNSATVSGGADVNPFNNTANDPTNITPTPDLTITKNHVGVFSQGQTGATYTITVSNVGGAPTDGTLVTVTDAVPAGLTATGIAGLNWTCTQPSGPCTRTDVLPTSQSYPSLTLTVNVANNAPTGVNAVTNTATVAGGGDVNGGNNTANDPTTIVIPPDLAITKTHTGNFFQGQLGATYTITVTNVGGAAKAAGDLVTVTDTLPSGLTATSIAGTGWTCTQPFGPCTRTDVLGSLLTYPTLTLTVDVANNAGASVTNSVTVATPGDVNPANNTASDPTTVAGGPNPGITKTHTGNFFQGQVGATYTITVTNSGATPTVGTVTVSDTLPAGLTATSIAGTGWACTQPSGPCSRADALGTGLSYPVLTLTVTVANNASASVTNSATVSGGGDVVPGNNTANDPTTVAGGPDPSITKTHTGNFFQGQIGVTYTITVTNNGATPTVGTVTVSDTVPVGLTATSIAGTGWTCTQPSGPCSRNDALGTGLSYPALTLTANVTNTASASITNTATVTGGGDVNPANNTANDPTTVAAGPDLRITKTHTGNFFQGQTGATYTITVTNVGGTRTMGTTTVTDTLPAGLTATSITSPSAGWVCTQPSGPCTNVNMLAAGVSYLPLVLTVNVATNAPASVTNMATVSNAGDVNPANDTANDLTTVNTASDLTITKTHTGNFTQGQVGATYTIRVTNVGVSSTSGTVTVTDTLPAGLTATSITSPSAGWVCTQPSGPCTNMNKLAAGVSYLPLVLTVNVAAGAPASVTNTATVSGGGDVNAANNTANDITTINTASDLTITKTHTGNFTQGQVGATYTIRVTNVGTGSTSGTVTVTDTLPASLTATSITSPSAGWVCTQPSGPCTNVNKLAAGVSYLPLVLTVNVAAGAPASVTNTATVSGGGDTNPANNTANDITTINTASDLTITKTHVGNFTQGQVGARYTITVSNVGVGSTTGTVMVTDTLPTGLTATSITSTSAGWVCTQPSGPCTNVNKLAPGVSYLPLVLTVNVAVGAPASVTNSATVSGGADTNPANNTANDITTINP